MENAKTAQADNQTNLLAILLAPLINDAVSKAIANIQNSQTTGPEIPINIHEAAAISGKAVTTLYIDHSKGKIPDSVCVKHGRRLYFYKSALLEWIRNGNNVNQIRVV
jgi:predicted DNA-binding transcriptional regulator AlpA